METLNYYIFLCDDGTAILSFISSVDSVSTLGDFFLYVQTLVDALGTIVGKM